RMAPRILLSSKESITDQAPGRKGRLKAGKTAADAHQESAFGAAPSAGLRYRFARALATRINAATFHRSPIISGPFCRPADLVTDDRNPHSGADPCPHGGNPPARQAVARHRRPADDRPRAAAG